MKCLILAAGRGERLGRRTERLPKPLIPLLGLPIIERVIRTVAQTGCHNFIIVTGYMADALKKHLRNGSHLGVHITYCHNQDWEKTENGSSVLAAKEPLQNSSEFLLVMADHLISAEMVQCVASVDLKNASCALAVDFSPRYINLDDATKVCVKDGKVVAISKRLSSFNGVDTGVFKATPLLFDALQKASERGDTTLSGGVRLLAEKGGVISVDVTGSLWCDLDSPTDWKFAKRVLLSTLKKPTDGPISRFLNRPISTRLSAFLVHLPITPNTLSVVSFLICLIAASLFAFWGRIGALMGGIIAQIASIIDGCDGEVARLRFATSRYGAWLDAVLDRYADAALLASIAANIESVSPHPAAWLLALAATLGSVMNAYTAIKHDAIFKKGPYFRFGRDIRMFTLMLAGVIAFIYQHTLILFLAIIAVVTNAVNIIRLIRHRNIN